MIMKKNRKKLMWCMCVCMCVCVISVVAFSASGQAGTSVCGCPKNNDGMMIRIPHPTDCAKFCECHNGVGTERDCPLGFHFNARISMCDWPEIADCR